MYLIVLVIFHSEVSGSRFLEKRMIIDPKSFLLPLVEYIRI